MTALDELRRRLERVAGDPELRRLAPGLTANVAFHVGNGDVRFSFVEGNFLPGIAGTPGGTDIEVAASEDAWREVLADPPPPTYHSFTAWQLANQRFEVAGDPFRIAQARPAMERVVELLIGASSMPAQQIERDVSQITGRYHAIRVGKESHEVYCEEAGTGIPILFLHTAGADGRQFLGQTSDVALARRFHMHALDLPFHGRSLPPHDWSGAPYQLSSLLYRSWCEAFIEQVIGEPPIIVGCSMGAAMALVMAAECPDLVRGIVALEPPFKSPGRRNPYQNHVGVHGGLHNGSFVRGLMSPTSPIGDRRRASWIYSQGGPGIYPGDLAFYSDEFDGAVVAPKIDAARTSVALLSGVYDYSATPADGAKLAALIPGSLHIIMQRLGHFPMAENPNEFREFLLKGLQHAAGGDAGLA